MLCPRNTYLFQMTIVPKVTPAVEMVRRVNLGSSSDAGPHMPFKGFLSLRELPQAALYSPIGSVSLALTRAADALSHSRGPIKFRSGRSALDPVFVTHSDLIKQPAINRTIEMSDSTDVDIVDRGDQRGHFDQFDIVVLFR
jgi:hypothetical protein